MNMSAQEAQLRATIVEVGRRLYNRGLIVAGDGNISARLDNDCILVTPAGLCKGELSPDDLVVVNGAGELQRAAPNRRSSSELLLHLHVYRRRPSVLACVHAHPPTAVALTLAGVSMAAPLLPEAMIALGPVPTAPYALTGTAEMGDAIDELVADHEAILLSHHGALTLGNTVNQAFARMEQVEHCAKILLAAHQLGPVQALAPERIAELRQLHQRYRTATAPQES